MPAMPKYCEYVMSQNWSIELVSTSQQMLRLSGAVEFRDISHDKQKQN